MDAACLECHMTSEVLVICSERKSTVFTNEDVHEKIKKAKRSYDKILIY